MRQRQGDAEAVADLWQHRRLADERAAEIEARELAEEADELGQQRLIGADLRAGRLDLRWRRADAEQRVGGVARQEPQQHEQYHRRLIILVLSLFIAAVV